jgi:hypothetical protein
MTTILDAYFARPPANVGILMLDGAIPMYADTLRYLTFEMRRVGIEAKLIGCAGGLSTCISLRAKFQGKPLSVEQRKATCLACQKAQAELGASLRRVFEREPDPGSDIFLKDVQSKLQEQDTLEHIVDVCWDTDEICKIAFFDFSGSHKVNLSDRLSAEQKADYLDAVADLLALRTYFERVGTSEDLGALLYINGNYSQNQLAYRVFARHGIPCLSIEPQLSSSSARNAVTLVPERIKLFPTALAGIDESRLLSVRDLKFGLSHFFARIAGNEFNAYTRLSADHASLDEAGLVRKFFDRYADVRSYFLSSEDELHAHEVVFGHSTTETQFEVLKQFLAKAAIHPVIGFVVRLHPRMAANKRSHFSSLEHARYAERLSQQKLPDNVLVLLGDCPISSYFIASKSSLIIVSWSTIGLETLLLGRPTLALFPEKLMYPISAFNRQPEDRAGIFALAFADKVEVAVQSIPLLNWDTYAYQQQFTPVPVPRSSNPFFSSRLYTWAFNRAKRHGLLELWFKGDGIWLSLRRTLSLKPATDATKVNKLAQYRQAADALFRRYGENLGITQHR